MGNGNGTVVHDSRVDPYVTDHSDFVATLPDSEPKALMALRSAGISRFAEAGFPSTKDEDWRFTNVTPIAETRFRFRPAGGVDGSVDAGPARLVPHAITLVFVNGRFAPELSATAEGDGERKSPVGAGGAWVGRIADAVASHGDKVLAHLGRHAAIEGNPFAALNTAFLSDGAHVYVPRGVAVDRPIQIVHLSSGAVEGDATAIYPRTLIVLDQSAEATVLESYGSIGNGRYLTCPVTEVVLGPNATLDHYRLQEDARSAYHMGTFQADLSRDSVLRSHNLTVGARLSRADVNARLGGDGVDCTLNGLYLANGDQHIDTHMWVEHVRPHGQSHELYKGILDDRASAVFNGRIYVHPEAQKTDAKQSNRNLLLSREALVNSNPQLEIFADDVKCTHGSTVGQLDEEAIFYLRTRGIGEEAARSLLIYAFADDILSGVRVPSLRNRLEATLRDRLPRSEIVREVV